MFRKLLLISLAVISMYAYSATTWTNGNQIINHIIWKPGHHGFYVVPETYDDPNSCGGTSNLYVIDPALSEKDVDRLYSMMLVAFSSRKKIHAWVSGCQGKLPQFSGLQIND